MEISELRKILHEYLEEADLHGLNIIHEAVAAYERRKSEISQWLGPMTEDALTERVMLAEERYNKGIYLTHDEVLTSIKTWSAGE